MVADSRRRGALIGPRVDQGEPPGTTPWRTLIVGLVVASGLVLLGTSQTEAQYVIRRGYTQVATTAPTNVTYVNGAAYPGGLAPPLITFPRWPPIGRIGTVVVNGTFVPPYSYQVVAPPWPARHYQGYGTNDFPFYGKTYGRPYDAGAGPTWAADTTTAWPDTTIRPSLMKRRFVGAALRTVRAWCVSNEDGPHSGPYRHEHSNQIALALYKGFDDTRIKVEVVVIVKKPDFTANRLGKLGEAGIGCVDCRDRFVRGLVEDQVAGGKPVNQRRIKGCIRAESDRSMARLDAKPRWSERGGWLSGTRSKTVPTVMGRDASRSIRS